MKDVEANRKGGKIRISEIYASLQGEGILTGTPSTFLRTSGCNLRCWFCDTPFASWHPEGEFLTVDEICARVARLKDRHVVITGGEPMIYNSLPNLCERLSGQARHITIETSGTVYHELRCDLMSISPKLSRSGPQYAINHPDAPNNNDASRIAESWSQAHERRRQSQAIVARLIENYDYQLKFVVDDSNDADEVIRYIDALEHCDRSRVLIMPQGTEQATLEEKARWLMPWCQEHQLRYCPRAHIAWYGNKRGT